MNCANGIVRILQVEDDRVYLRLMQKKLTVSELPHELTQVETMREAEEFLSSNKVDVILLDLNLPDSVDGDGMTRLQQAAPHVPIIIVTAAGSRETMVQMFTRGAVAFVEKGTMGPQGVKRVIQNALALGCAMRVVPCVEAVPNYS